MKMIRSAGSTAMLLSLVVVAGCGDNTTAPDFESREPINMTTIGRGTVAERYTSEIAVIGNTGYTGTWSVRGGIRGNTVKIWDLTPAAPVLVDSIMVQNAMTIGDLQISDDGKLLVVANEANPTGAITLFDLTNPRTPQFIARFSNEEIAFGVHTVKLARVDGRHYAFLSIDPFRVNNTPVPARLVIVDITTPAQPAQVFSQAMGSPYVHDVFVRDGLLFTALWDDGLTAWDIGGGGRGGTPANPVQLGNVKTVGGAAHNVYWFHNPESGSKRYIFVGEEQIVPGGSAGDIHVIDASDFAQMKEVAFFHLPNVGTHNFAVDEHNSILYAAYYEAGVRALDIRGDLHTCTAAERAADGRCDLGLMEREIGRGLTTGGVKIWGVALNDTHLFASDMLWGIWKIDNSALR